MVGGYIQNAKEVTQIAEKSENIRIKKDNNGKIKPSGVQIKLANKWYSIDDIQNISEDAKTGKLSIKVGDKAYKIDDKSVKEMLKYMKKLK